MEPPSLSRDAGHNAPSIRPEKSVRSSVSRTARTASAGSGRKSQMKDPGFLFVDLVDLPHRDRRELRSHVMKRVVHQKKRKKDPSAPTTAATKGIVPSGEPQLLPKTLPIEPINPPKVDKYLPAGRVDPFNCLALPMTHSMHYLFDYYATVLGPLHYPPPRTLGRNPMTLTWISAALNDSALLHSTLSSASGFLHGNANKPSRDPQLLADHFQHKAEAMRLVNERVQSDDMTRAASDETLGAIALLLTNQTIQGDFFEMMVHMRGLARLVQWRGGLEGLGMGGLLAGELLWCDNVSAFIIGSKPLLTLPETMYTVLTTFDDPAINAIFDLPLPPPGASLLSDPEISSVLSEDLLLLFRSLDTMTTLLNTIPALSEYDMLIFDRRRAILQHHLANLQHLPAITETDKTTAACLLATIVYSMLALWGFRPPSEAYSRISYRFRPALMKTDLNNHWGKWWELLLWVLFMGAYSSLETDETTWLCKRIEILCESKGLTEWEDVRATLYRLPMQDALMSGFQWLWVEQCNGNSKLDLK